MLGRGPDHVENSERTFAPSASIDSSMPFGRAVLPDVNCTRTPAAALAAQPAPSMHSWNDATRTDNSGMNGTYA